MKPLGVAAGFVDITPPRPIALAGYANRAGSCAGVADPLEANVVVIQTTDQPLVLASFDLLYVGDELRHRLEQSLAAEVSAERLFLTASHTHFAPGTDVTLPRLGPVEPDYVSMVAERVEGLVRALLRVPGEALRIGVGATTADHAVNRRRVGWRLGRRFPFLHHGAWMMPNPAGHKDDTIRIVRLGANVLAWNYACHPVFVPWMDHVSADFVGVVRAALRHAFGPATTVLFWQGFSGDIYPSFAATLTGMSARLKRLLRQPIVVEPLVWRSWCDTLAQRVVEAARTLTLRECHGAVDARRQAMQVSHLLDGRTCDKRIHAHRLTIGEDVRVLGISAEVVSEYVPIVQREFGDRSLICVGCIDGVFGYIPTSRMVREGGYEAGGFLPAFSLDGEFLDDPESRVQQRLLAA